MIVGKNTRLLNKSDIDIHGWFVTPPIAYATAEERSLYKNFFIKIDKIFKLVYNDECDCFDKGDTNFAYCEECGQRIGDTKYYFNTIKELEAFVFNNNIKDYKILWIEKFYLIMA